MADNTHRHPLHVHNSSHHAKDEYNNCFIIYSKQSVTLKACLPRYRLSVTGLILDVDQSEILPRCRAVQQHSRQERMISCSRLLQLWRSHKLNLTWEQNELNRSALKMWSVQWQIYWLYNLVLIKMEPNWEDIWIYEHERPYSKSIHSLSPSGIWIFDKLVLKFPTAWAKKPLKCPIIGPFLEKINRFGHRDRRFLSGLGSIYRGFQREADGFRTGGEFMIIIYQLPGLASRQDQV